MDFVTDDLPAVDVKHHASVGVLAMIAVGGRQQRDVLTPNPVRRHGAMARDHALTPLIRLAMMILLLDRLQDLIEARFRTD